MRAFAHFVSLTAPLFALVFVGFALARWARWPASVSEGLARFVFSTAIPASIPLSLIALGMSLGERGVASE
jgi:malonate transporter